MLDQAEFLGEPGHRRLGDDEAVGGEHVAVDLGHAFLRARTRRRRFDRAEQARRDDRRGRDGLGLDGSGALRERARHGRRRGRGRGRTQRRAES